MNLFIGGSVVLGDVAGSSLEIVQKTNYPWDGRVAIVLNPVADARFTLKIRVPDRSVSGCYSDSPQANGLRALSVNGKPVPLSPIAYNATPSSSFCSSWESVYGLDDQVEPKTSADRGERRCNPQQKVQQSGRDGSAEEGTLPEESVFRSFRIRTKPIRCACHSGNVVQITCSEIHAIQLRLV